MLFKYSDFWIRYSNFLCLRHQETHRDSPTCGCEGARGAGPVYSVIAILLTLISFILDLGSSDFTHTCPFSSTPQSSWEEMSSTSHCTCDILRMVSLGKFSRKAFQVKLNSLHSLSLYCVTGIVL